MTKADSSILENSIAAMHPFSATSNLPKMRIDLGPPNRSSQQQSEVLSDTSWRRRCLRKQRRSDDEGCAPKKRRLVEAESGPRENSSICDDRPPERSCPPLSARPFRPVLPQSRQGPQDIPLPESSALTHPVTDGSCMEIEAAPKKHQDIENITTREDENDDLDVEPTPRLVMSDALKARLQRGISDILPPTVVQSVRHSCMQLVVWKPPEDALFLLKEDSVPQRQRKHQTSCRPTPDPCPSPSPQSSTKPTDFLSEHTYSPLYNIPANSSDEVDMEL